jgi:hypothetical protein
MGRDNVHLDVARRIDALAWEAGKRRLPNFQAISLRELSFIAAPIGSALTAN